MDLWRHIEEERADLAAFLHTLAPGHWDAPSLCTRWRVRGVVAHLTGEMTGIGPGPMYSRPTRAGFNFNRFIAEDAVARAKRASPAQLLSGFERALSNRRHPPEAKPVHLLADAVIHAQDIRRPLGQHLRDIPAVRLVAVANMLRGMGSTLGAKKRIAGLQLTADDINWSTGEGPVVRGPAEALILVMAGRPAALADLRGRGKKTLVSRLG